MSVEQDVEKLEGLVKQIEDYVKRGVWEASQQDEILAMIVQADAIYSLIISSWVDTDGIPPVQQAYQVSDFQERLHRAKHNLPLPPLRQESKNSLVTDKKVTIYTAPT